METKDWLQYLRQGLDKMMILDRLKRATIRQTNKFKTMTVTKDVCTSGPCLVYRSKILRYMF